MGVGAARLAAADVPWIADYVSNMRLVVDDPRNVFTPDNALRFQLINLQPMVYALFDDVSVVNAVSVLVGASLFIAWWVRVRRESATSEVLGVSALSVMSLLPVSHHFYDAWLLTLPLCWALMAPPSTHRRLVLLLITPFVIPVVGFVLWLKATGRLPVELVAYWWWEPVVMFVQNWALVILAAVLVAAIGTPTEAAEETSSLRAVSRR